MNDHSIPPVAEPTRSSRGRLATPASVFAALLSTWSAPAFADLYTWTDERGTTVLSNIMPANPRRVSNFEVLVKEDPKQAASRAAAEAHERAATQQVLLERIDSLEREIKAQQVRTAAPPAPADTQYSAPPRDYTADTFYPGYYPSYVFPYPPAYPWGYPPTTVVMGSQFGAPYRGYGPYRSYPYSSSRVVSRPVSVPVSVPVTVPAGYPVTVTVRR